MCIYNILEIFIGFNVETVEYKNIKFTVWDVGGQDKVTNISIFNFIYLYIFIKMFEWLIKILPNYFINDTHQL